jgi:acetyltransferase-like isoleucine patch superfamily enzyme
MGVLNKLYVKFLNKLRYDLERNPVTSNIIRLKDSSGIGKNTLLRNTRIYGSVTIGENCKIIDGVTIRAGSKVNIGNFSSINGPNTDILSKIYPVTIGSFCSIARSVSIQEFNHKVNGLSSYHINSNLKKESVIEDVSSKNPIEIGHDVWIGAHCVVLSGAKIGTGAVIAANSVVTNDIPPYAIAAGTPAKVIKYRFEQVKIDELMGLKWWNLPINEIIKLHDQFQ